MASGAARGSACFVLVLACATNEPDDGDSGAGSSSSTTAMTEPTSDASEGGTEASPECIDALEEADAFIVSNSACNTDEDCAVFSGACHPMNTCGGVAMNAAADETEWNALYAPVEAECGPCGSDPCVACAVCNVVACALTLDCPG